MNVASKKDRLYEDNNFLKWKKRWEERLLKNNNTPTKYKKLMRNNNPLFIPRNHKIEEALEAAENDDLIPFHKVLKILKKPYMEQDRVAEYQTASTSNEKYQTFCGT